MSSPLGVTPLAASALHTRCEVVLKAVAPSCKDAYQAKHTKDRGNSPTRQTAECAHAFACIKLLALAPPHGCLLARARGNWGLLFIVYICCWEPGVEHATLAHAFACRACCLLRGGLSVVSPRGGTPRQTSTRQSPSPSGTSTTLPQEFFANLIVWCALHREYTLHEDLT